VSNTQRYRSLAESLLRTFDNPTWVCHHCAAHHPITGPAYPICPCGNRCRFIDVGNSPYVGGAVSDSGQPASAAGKNAQ
jgi:hypothetical protein